MTNPTSAVNPSDQSIAELRSRPDDEPIIMVNLLKFASSDGRRRYAAYGAVAGKEIAQRGGRVIYSGASLGPGVGENADWDSIALVYYPRRAAWLDMQDSPAYQAAIADRTAGLANRLLYAFKRTPGSPALDDVPLGGETAIVVANLVAYNGDEGRAAYRAYGDVADPMIRGVGIRELGGDLLLRLTAEQALVSDDVWHSFLLVRYPSIDALRQMTSDPEWRAANTEHRQKGLANTIAFPTRQQ